jgi:hypothetical protein
MHGYHAGRHGDEDEQIELHLAREQGDAFGAALEHVVGAAGGHGAQRRAGDYWVAYATRPAVALYGWAGDELVWQEPVEANVYLGVTVRDGGDGRFLPCARVVATLIAADGQQLGPHEHPLVWHPTLYHYGRNWRLPASGLFTLRVRVDPPLFMRHDHVIGDRFKDAVEVDFPHLELRYLRDQSQLDGIDVGNQPGG